jgi:RNA polymerase sigma factor (sigma-70 family)
MPPLYSPDSSLIRWPHSRRGTNPLDDSARYRWIGRHILVHEAQARRWLSRHVRSLSPNDADDLIQEAYLRIWSSDLASIQNPRAYLFASLRNLLLEQARHASIVPMERMGEIDELRIFSDDPGPERRIAARQELERLCAVVVSLPAQCRRVFELRKVQGMRQRDVASEMGISERTVEKHLAKALDRILEAFMREPGRDAGSYSIEAEKHGTTSERD